MGEAFLCFTHDMKIQVQLPLIDNNSAHFHNNISWPSLK